MATEPYNSDEKMNALTHPDFQRLKDLLFRCLHDSNELFGRNSNMKFQTFSDMFLEGDFQALSKELAIVLVLGKLPPERCVVCLKEMENPDDHEECFNDDVEEDEEEGEGEEEEM